jgi:hypothetical protein
MDWHPAANSAAAVSKIPVFNVAEFIGFLFLQPECREKGPERKRRCRARGCWLPRTA